MQGALWPLLWHILPGYKRQAEKNYKQLSKDSLKSILDIVVREDVAVIPPLRSVKQRDKIKLKSLHVGILDPRRLTVF